MTRFKRKGNIILTVALVAVIALGTFGFINLFKRIDNLEPTKTVNPSLYARGLLDDATGKLPKEYAKQLPSVEDIQKHIQK